MAALQVNASLGSINPKTLLPNTVTTNREISATTLAAAAAVDAATLAADVLTFEASKDLLATNNTTLTADAAALATHASSLDTHNTSAGTQAINVEAAVAVLEADGALPTEAHVDALRVVWDLLAATLVLIDTDNTNVDADSTAITATAALIDTDNTAVAADYTAIAAVSVLLTADTAAASAGAGGDVNVSWDTSTVTTVSRLKVALDQVLRSAASSLPP